MLSIFEPIDLLYTEEPKKGYCFGGFHPVCLGDTFELGRYQIHHKLGFGNFSTVWLAWDMVLEEWVAIKIMLADDSKGNRRDVVAIQALQETRASKHIVELLNFFTHQGPNGSHECLVFDLFGPTLKKVLKDHSFYEPVENHLEPKTILKITKQLLKAVASLLEAGYAHGDITAANIAFTGSNLTLMSEKDILQLMGPTESYPLVRLDNKSIEPGMPRQLVVTAFWDEWVEEDEEDIRLIDFGETFAHDASKLTKPSGLEVPELIFSDSFDYRVDLWGVGCIICSMLLGRRLFCHYKDIDDLVADMVSLLGDLPKEWEPEWMLMKERAGGKWDRVLSEDYTLEREFDDRVHHPSLKKLLPIVRGLMKFRPSDRIEASKALKLVYSIIQELK